MYPVGIDWDIIKIFGTKDNSLSAPGNVTKNEYFLLSLRGRNRSFVYRDFRPIEFDFVANFDTIDNSQVIPVQARNFNVSVYMEITFGPSHMSKIWQQNWTRWVWKPYTQNFRAIYLKMKESIYFHKHPVSSYASQSGYIWCWISLLPWQ